MPEDLVDEIMESPKHVKEIGKNWTRKQLVGLMNSGMECIHFYVMNDASSTVDIIKEMG